VSSGAGGFRHEALFYAGPDEFVAATAPFIRAGLERGEPVLVCVDPTKVELLRAALGRSAEAPQFVDMTLVGRNPARIIPVWRSFVDEHAAHDRSVRGVAEPMWPGRSGAELVECQHHEALLNVAFADDPPFWLLCPLDETVLPSEVMAGMRTTHPFTTRHGEGGTHGPGPTIEVPSLLAEALPEPPGPVADLEFDSKSLPALRRFVERFAIGAGLAAAAARDIALAANELGANSVRHGGGSGRLRIWREGRSVISEVVDRGRLTDWLAGRRRPGGDDLRGRGLWMVNQLCDLTQIRSSGAGTVVRVRKQPGETTG
jgi:anti-sigma regulatory factor (Ser/Thr protein kinase)